MLYSFNSFFLFLWKLYVTSTFQIKLMFDITKMGMSESQWFTEILQKHTSFCKITVIHHDYDILPWYQTRIYKYLVSRWLWLFIEITVQFKTLKYHGGLPWFRKTCHDTSIICLTTVTHGIGFNTINSLRIHAINMLVAIRSKSDYPNFSI